MTTGLSLTPDGSLPSKHIIFKSLRLSILAYLSPFSHTYYRNSKDVLKCITVCYSDDVPQTE